jgi:hypothetical protein
MAEGEISQIDLPGGTLERFDPWQNAATVAFHYYFAKHLSLEDYQRAVSPEGFAKTYSDLYGDPWQTQPHIPGSLRQPVFRLPFEIGKTWAFTGGPHGAWGSNAPLAAIDFAPPSVERGCILSDEGRRCGWSDRPHRYRRDRFGSGRRYE